MRYSLASLGLLLAALLGGAPLQTAWAQSAGDAWGTPVDLQSGLRLGSGSIGSDLITRVQEQEPAWDQAVPGWYARGEALFLRRDHARDRVISVIDPNAAYTSPDDDIPAITTNDLAFDVYEPGWRTELGRSFGNGLAIEGSYFLLSDWFATDQVTSNGEYFDNLVMFPIPSLPEDAISPQTPPGPPLPPNDFLVDDFYQALQHTVTYNSELFNAEINVRATWRWHSLVRSQFAGFRFLQLREDFMLVSQDDSRAVFFPPSPPPPNTQTGGFGVYDIRTKNTLLGAQYGEEVMIPVLPSCILTVTGKLGLYGNDIEQNRSIFNNGAFVVQVPNQETQLSVVGELGMFANVKVTDMLSIRGGYNLMWIDGVALAPDQFTFDFTPNDFSVFEDVNHNGTMFVHGFSIGAELRR